MSDSIEVGKIGWIDMGGYSDYVMNMPGGSFCVIEDPAGSVAGLYQPKAD